MGAVKIEVDKGSHQYRHVNLGDVDCIRGLIQYRSKLDKFFRLKQNYSPYEAGQIETFNEELDCLYLDLDELIKECKFTDKQNRLLKNIFENGWIEEDEELSDEEIVNIYGDTLKNIDYMLDRICLRIKESNDKKRMDCLKKKLFTKMCQK